MLSDTQTLAFLAATLLLTASPGADNLLVAGIGALVAASPWALQALTWAGGAA